MLGMFPSAAYQTRKFHLDKGDILITYADGLTKAENQRREIFGTERLLEIILRDGPLGGKAVELGMLKAVKEFTHGTTQPDDITFVVIEKFQ